MSFSGYFQKITNKKKLLIKVDEQDYYKLENQVNKCAKLAKIDDYRSPLFTVEDDAVCLYFVNVSLDRYDINNLPKFERMTKETVFIRGTMKAYNFTPKGEEHALCGVNLVLSSIGVIPQAVGEETDQWVEAQAKKAAALKKIPAPVLERSDSVGLRSDSSDPSDALLEIEKQIAALDAAEE